MTVVEKKFQMGQYQVSLQTGSMARQATASVVAKVGQSMVLATVVMQPSAEQKDFFPLSVHYQEKAYAYGRIPTGFKRREGPPSEREILISRLIDRPIRPLFPEWYTNEVQVVATLLSADPNVEPDIVAMIAASAAVRLAGLPIMNTLGAVRVGYVNHQFVLNPSLNNPTQLDLIIAGTVDSLLMVESSADQLPEETMVKALAFGHEHIREVINAIESFAELAGAPAVDITQPEVLSLPGFAEKAKEHASTYWERLSSHQDKNARALFMKSAVELLKSEYIESHPELTEKQLAILPELISAWEKSIVRQGMVQLKRRLDGRGFEEIRPIRCEVGLLPSSHGSALFTRGETQSLGALVLGSSRDVQIVESHDSNEEKESFILHYNFPPYSVGEVGQVGSPKRREIGHGRLARRAMEAVLPDSQKFPYAIRIVSEILESNGSSSMATVCSSTLALMDAGVPIKAPVAGIAMGLIQEGSDQVILSDILGDEDGLGDMDFKVAGTEHGITALQMDIKVSGISADVMKRALAQAHAGRMHILGIMKEALPAVRSEIAANAPRIDIVRIRPDQVREVIGKGGSTIKLLTELSNATLELTDDGIVNIVSMSKEHADKAKELLKQIVEPMVLEKVYFGQVTKMMDFGFVISILGGREGFVHISECPFKEEELPHRIHSGQRIEAKLIQIDKVNNRLKFSLL